MKLLDAGRLDHRKGLGTCGICQRTRRVPARSTAALHNAAARCEGWRYVPPWGWVCPPHALGDPAVGAERERARRTTQKVLDRRIVAKARQARQDDGPVRVGELLPPLPEE